MSDLSLAMTPCSLTHTDLSQPSRTGLNYLIANRHPGDISLLVSFFFCLAVKQKKNLKKLMKETKTKIDFSQQNESTDALPLGMRSLGGGSKEGGDAVGRI